MAPCSEVWPHAQSENTFTHSLSIFHRWGKHAEKTDLVTEIAENVWPDDRRHKSLSLPACSAATCYGDKHRRKMTPGAQTSWKKRQSGGKWQPHGFRLCVKARLGRGEAGMRAEGEDERVRADGRAGSFRDEAPSSRPYFQIRWGFRPSWGWRPPPRAGQRGTLGWRSTSGLQKPPVGRHLHIPSAPSPLGPAPREKRQGVRWICKGRIWILIS